MAISIPNEIQVQLKKSQVEQILRATCTSVHDTLAGGFTVGIKRAGQEFPDTVEYRYLGPAPTVGDDVLVFRVGSGYIVAGIDETVLTRDQSVITIVDSAVETTVFSFTIPANTFSTARGVRLFLAGDMLNNEATARDFTWRIKLGGVTIWGDAVLSLSAAAAGRRPWQLDITITPENSLAVQRMVGTLLVGSNAVPSIAGSGDGTGGNTGVIKGSAAADMSTNVLLEVSLQMSDADPLAEMVKDTAILERK